MEKDADARESLDLVVEAIGRTAAARLDQAAVNQAAVDQAAVDQTAVDAARMLDALQALHQLRERLDAWEPRLIEAARGHGVSWARLATVLGLTTRQAAERRYLRMRPAADAGLTREERVQAARDERAGNRAVAAWARENASELRQIAGQVSALAGLDSAARRDAAVLASSLTGDDPSTLIEPLADMHAHLVDEHVALAEQVAAVGQKVGHVRRETQRRRDAPDQS